MNNQQTLPTPFSVRIRKEDFLFKALKAYAYYAKSISPIQNTERLKTIINMVNISTDEFVTVTEDIYKLIYKCGS